MRLREGSRLLAMAAALWSIASGGALLAQEDPPEPAEAPRPIASPREFGLDATVRRSLADLQQDWSEWLAAYDLDDTEAEELALERLGDTVRGLGMKAVPELSLGAAVRAVESARLGDFRRAGRALAAADRLDADRPETAFATASVEWQRRDWWKVTTALVDGYSRVLRVPLERRLVTHNLVLWLVMSLLVTGCVFVAVLMFVRGPALFGSLLEALRRVVPVPLGLVIVIALLLWPVVLSGSILVLVLNWSILLWLYSERVERWVLACLWLIFAVTPILLDEQRRRIAVELAPMVLAADDARTGRLQGRLFTDLERLALVLPDSPAVSQLVADQHRRIGQCDRAMALYERVVELEPANAAAWVDLGSCHFLRGEYDQAIELYRRGTSLDATLAQGHFNLSLAFSELYRFAESERSLSRAQQLDSSRVARWLEETPWTGVAEVSAGLERVSDIRADLRRSWILEDDSAAWSSPLKDYISVPLAAAGLLLAVALGRFLPRGQREAQAPPVVDWNSRWGSTYRVLVPGLPEVEAGESIFGAFSILAATAIVLVPWVGHHGYAMPWGYEPEVAFSWVVMVGGLAIYLGWRWRREMVY